MLIVGIGAEPRLPMRRLLVARRDTNTSITCPNWSIAR
jgi:hypothetical protein